MDTGVAVIALLFLSVIADATNVSLANNTTFLLLLLLALSDTGSTCGCNRCSCGSTI